MKASNEIATETQTPWRKWLTRNVISSVGPTAIPALTAGRTR